ncbi:hypothetical protein K502DRAFT_323939 [Neoconidiobolus thromboides FSU 785]|nr:hypothetical protein K502DRAFT_323939 [Neoconidiobolus thromboides FSU 785]
MDIVLTVCDYLFYDTAYNLVSTKFNLPYLPRDDLLRQFISLLLITSIFGFLVYFIVAGLSYHFVYDKRLMEHPRFLPNQIQLEIQCAAEAIIPMSILTVPFFLLEVNGYSKLYSNIDDYGIPYLFASIIGFLIFTDFGIYVIHRGLHHRSIYAHVHKLHHKWLVPTPFASHAFHFLDGYSQSLPYHFAVFLFPIHKLVYLGLFMFVNVWTVLIHDGEYFDSGEIINSASNHTIHHLYFNFNYGQYFTFWDKVFNSYRQCPNELLDREKRHDVKSMNKVAKEVDIAKEEIEKPKVQ